MKKPVRYGIIGLGQVSMKGHIPNLLSLPEAQIVAVSDTCVPALATAMQMIGPVHAYADAQDLITDPAVEAVLVAVPNWLHKEFAVKALAAGKHVFCEKPLGIDLHECDAILAAQRKSGKLLQVGHEMRYSKLVRTLHAKARSGLIGQVQMIVVHEYRHPLLPGWRQTGKTGGVMLEKNSHYFDLFNWFADAEPKRVLGMGGNNVNKASPLMDHCIVAVEYANRVRAALIMCLFSEHGSPLTIDVVGDKGRLIAYEEDRRLLHYTRTSSRPDEWSFRCDDEGAWHAGFRAEHQAFIRCIRHGKKVLVDGPAARRAMRLSLAAERAVSRAQSVCPAR